MESNTTNDTNKNHTSREQRFDFPELARKIWCNRKPILKACGIGAIVGIIIGFGIPKEYTASTLIAPESTSKRFSPTVNALADMAGLNSSFDTGREAIYPSLYPTVIHSTPFLIQLFEVRVSEKTSNVTMPLSQYLKKRQKRPWWSIITSAPSRLVHSMVSLLKKKPHVEKAKPKSEIDLFHLTREQAGIAGAISSRIKVGVDKKKRTITIFVTMQDPLVAATVADTVCVRLKEYITEYRTAKAHKILEYNESLRKEAEAKYYASQEKYARYADANRSLAMLTSRAELARLRNEMELALSVYNQMELRVRAAQARIEKETPVYAVIQPAVVPLRPSNPRKMKILAGCILLGGAGSVSWILFGMDFLKAVRRASIRRRADEKDTKADD